MKQAGHANSTKKLKFDTTNLKLNNNKNDFDTKTCCFSVTSN